MADQPKIYDFRGVLTVLGAMGAISLALGVILLIPAFRLLCAPPHANAEAWQGARHTVEGLQHYFEEYHTHLAGDNAYVTGILMGNNPHKIAFIVPSTKLINNRGEYTDPWGTPYQFDFSDPEHPRIWSCGRDRHDDHGATGSDDITSWR